MKKIEMKGYNKKHRKNVTLSLQDEGIMIESKSPLGFGGTGSEFIRYLDVISLNVIPGTLGKGPKMELITAGFKRKYTYLINSDKFVIAANYRINKSKNPKPETPKTEYIGSTFSPGSIDLSKIDINAPPMEQVDTEDVNFESPIDLVTENPLEIIRKSKELLDLGAITEKEFQSIKEKYLEKI